MFLEPCPFVLSGAELAAGAAVVEFGLVVSANAVQCRIVIPASAPQTKQRCFLISGFLLAQLVSRKDPSKRVVVLHGSNSCPRTNERESFVPVPASRASVKDYQAGPGQLANSIR
jgi:hypothetical protein